MININLIEELVEAILTKQKTQLRIPWSIQPVHLLKTLAFTCPYGYVGDHITINEKHILKIVDVHIERLQKITEDSAITEGVLNEVWLDDKPVSGCWYNYIESCFDGGFDSAIDSYKSLWKYIYGDRYLWDTNPITWVIDFECVEKATQLTNVEKTNILSKKLDEIIDGSVAIWIMNQYKLENRREVLDFLAEKLLVII